VVSYKYTEHFEGKKQKRKKKRETKSSGDKEIMYSIQYMRGSCLIVDEQREENREYRTDAKS
jgi:hypothetical protein